MKTKIVAILLCIFSVVLALSFGGCDWEPPVQTEEDVIDTLKNIWDVYIPENITLTTYFLNAGINDYDELYVVEYKDNDEKFTQQLSSERNEDVENFFKDICQRNQNKFVKEYTLPDIPEDYYWLYKEELKGTIVKRFLYILYIPLYIPTENLILLYDFLL